MAVVQRFIGGVKALLGGRRAEQELDDEVQAYLDSAIEAKVRAGMTPDDARRAARVELGSIDAVKEQTRDVGWESTVEHACRDVRYASRTLRKSPAFSAVVVLTLTLGIGANTAIFSAVNAIMLRALPAERPEELISADGAVSGRRGAVLLCRLPQHRGRWGTSRRRARGVAGPP